MVNYLRYTLNPIVNTCIIDRRECTAHNRMKYADLNSCFPNLDPFRATELAVDLRSVVSRDTAREDVDEDADRQHVASLERANQVRHAEQQQQEHYGPQLDTCAHKNLAETRNHTNKSAREREKSSRDKTLAAYVFKRVSLPL